MTKNLTSTLKQVRKKVRHLLIGHLSFEHATLQQELEGIKLAIGRHEARAVSSSQYQSIQDAEFKVFSQFGEDGIIQYLISKILIPNKIFIELGVGDYAESNTRFLLMNNNWRGKIVNDGDDHISFIQSKTLGDFYYRYDIEAISAFIDKDNINSIIKKMSVPEDIGLLSIDLDGIDYWIWDAVNAISPRIVIIEYTSHFGVEHPITVPYKRNFNRTQEHYSNLYFGSSLPAICFLADKKGYTFVGSNSSGTNAFFVRNDVSESLPHLTAKKGYVQSSYRESKDKAGNLTFISSHRKRRELIAQKKVINVQSRKEVTIGSLYPND